MEDIDIKNFTRVSSVTDEDSVLLSRGVSSATHGQIAFGLFRSSVSKDISPSIVNGIWYIGSTNTGIEAKGADGKTPVFSTGAVATGLPDTNVIVQVRYDGINENGNPSYVIDFTIPAGKPGQDGDGAGNVYVNTEGLKSGKTYLFQPGADGSANGTMVEFTGKEIEGGVGKEYPGYPGAEIFNDYENNIAAGKNAHAEGRETNATGPRAHAEGYQTKVFAANAHAEGRKTWCLGSQGHVEGFYSISYGANSHVEGTAYDRDWGIPATKVILATKDEEFIRSLYDNTDYFFVSDKALLISDKFFEDYIIHASFGERSHVEGTNNACFDNSSHVEGFENRCGSMITGHGYALVHNANHVEGRYNYIGGTIEYTYTIHIEGNNNEFRGNYNYPTHAIHIEGQYNTIPLLTEGTSSCNGAHLGGEYSKIIGGRSTFAHGYNISVRNDYETSFGKYNASEINGKKVLFSYGIGSSDNDRKNAISVFSDGSVEIPNLIGLNILEQLEEKLLPLQNKVDGLLRIINQLPSIKVYAIGSNLVFTEYIDASIEGSILIVNDSGTSVNEELLVLPGIKEANAKVENGILIL